MKTIYKFHLFIDDDANIVMPVGAQIIAVQGQWDSPQLWAMVDTNAPEEVRTFCVYGTGHPLPEDPGTYIGTVQTHGGRFVWHVFELARPADGGLPEDTP